MENLYFPAFLVGTAVLVIWLYSRSRRADVQKTREKQRLKRRRHVHASSAKAPPIISQKKRQLKSGSESASNTMWSNRRQRASHDSALAEEDLELKTIQAAYLKPDADDHLSRNSYGVIRDQDDEDLEFVGFDEYLAQQRKQKQAQEEGHPEELEMTAIKFESDDSESDQPATDVKRTGFKP